MLGLILKDITRIIDDLIHRSYIEDFNREYHSLFRIGLSPGDRVYYRNYSGEAFNYRLRDYTIGVYAPKIYRILRTRDGIFREYYTGYMVPKNY